MIRFSCPSCSTSLSAPPGTEGRQARCKCGASVAVPTHAVQAETLTLPNEAIRAVSPQKWGYLIEDVYEDYSFIPASIDLGRLMTVEELNRCCELMMDHMADRKIRRKDVTDITMVSFLETRGLQGWEIAQATRIEQKPLALNDAVFWKIIFKRPRA